MTITDEVMKEYTARIIWREFRSEGITKYKLLKIKDFDRNYLNEDNNRVYYLQCDCGILNLFLRVAHEKPNYPFDKVKYTIKYKYNKLDEWKLHKTFIEVINTEI